MFIPIVSGATAAGTGHPHGIDRPPSDDPGRRRAYLRGPGDVKSIDADTYSALVPTSA